jgi:hypothetical protein
MTMPPTPATPPSILYHYTTLAGACGIATTKRLWASSIRHLSDSTEFTYAHSVLRRALEDAVRGLSSQIITATEFLLGNLDASKIQNGLNFMGPFGSTYVVSLSREPDKLSQWRTYCPDGGYAFGFRVDALEAIASNQQFRLVECSYDEDQHLLDAHSLAYTVLSEVERALRTASISLPALLGNASLELQQRLYPIRRNMLNEIQRLAPTWKHPSFVEEAEWRLVSQQQQEDRKVKFRAGRTAIIPYVEVELNKPESTQSNGMTAVLTQTCVGPCPEPEIAVGSLMHLFQAENIACPQYALSRTPYRHW